MVRKFAVLWDVEGPESREAGVVVERDDHVLVDVSSRYCIPPRQRGEYVVADPDGTLVRYQPNSPGFFSYVLGALSSTFAIGEQGEFDDREMTAPELYTDKVTKRLMAKERRTYDSVYTADPYPSRVGFAPGESQRPLVA